MSNSDIESDIIASALLKKKGKMGAFAHANTLLRALDDGKYNINDEAREAIIKTYFKICDKVENR
jgi:hypothetical protein